MVCPPELQIIHSLKHVDYLSIQAGNPCCISHWIKRKMNLIGVSIAHDIFSCGVTQLFYPEFLSFM